MSPAAGRDLLVERGADGCATVRFNRPAKRNAINLAMWQELRRIFDDLGEDAGVRTIVLTGNGGNFSAGADLGEFATVRTTVALATKYEETEIAALRAILVCPKPVIAQIEGYAVGGGCAVALACDVRVADSKATFFIPAGRLGTVYSELECGLLLRQVGLANAKAILFAGERLNAAEAIRLRLIDAVAESDVPAAVQRLVRRFVASAPLSNAGHKCILNALADGEAAARTGEIDRWIHLALASQDHAEGQRAFREKREPVFAGI